MDYGYEYFCGANVVVEFDGAPVLEIAGISYQESESKMPVYGYSSRHFDGVARGQVIVRGSLVVNYVHQDYLYFALKSAYESFEDIYGDERDVSRTAMADELSGLEARDAAYRAMQTDYRNSLELTEAFKERYWGQSERTLGIRSGKIVPNLHDIGPMNIKITFGERSGLNNNSGITGLMLNNVYFTGRGLPIQIDEEVLVEEYSFFARRVYSTKQEYVIGAEVTTPIEEAEHAAGVGTVAVRRLGTSELDSLMVLDRRTGRQR